MKSISTILGLLVLCSFSLHADDHTSGIQSDLVYGHKDGLALTMDLFAPSKEANKAAVLFMVSGGWVSRWSPADQMKSFFQPFLDAGYHVFAVRHGSSPRYTIPEAVSDVRKAVQYVRYHSKKFGIDKDRLGVFGMSAGGHLSLVLGTTGKDAAENPPSSASGASTRVAAVVAFVPPTDLTVAVWSSPESLPAYKLFPALNLEMEKAKEHSPLGHVTQDDAPSLVIMGGKDELVPPKHGEWIHEAFDNKKVENKLIVYPESGHGLEGNQTKAFQEAVTWFDSYLGSKKS